MKLRTLLVLVTFFLLAGMGRSQAQLLFTLTPDTQVGLPGTEVIFTGTLKNNGASDIFLNNLSFSFLGPATGTFLSGDTNIFFNNVPGILNPGDTYAGPVFGINIKATTPPNTYNGTVKILGGSDQNGRTNIAGASFHVTVSPAPTGLLTIGVMALCGFGFGVYNRRKRIC